MTVPAPEICIPSPVARSTGCGPCNATMGVGNGSNAIGLLVESDDHYGATLAALAVGVAPDDYASTEVAQEGLAGLRKYLRNNPPPTLHHQAMLMWASSYLDDLTTEEEKRACIEALLALQKEDGGWGLAKIKNQKFAQGTHGGRRPVEHASIPPASFVLGVA